MDTLILDLYQLIDKQLDCYQCTFLGYSDHKIRWAVYFYCRKNPRMVAFYEDNPDKDIVEIFKRYLESKPELSEYQYEDILKTAFKIGDEELIELVYNRVPVDSDKQTCILETIKSGHTALVLKYEHPCPNFRDMYTYDIHLPAKIVAAYRSRNQQIIDHILNVNSCDLDNPRPKLTRLLMMTSTASDTEKQQLNQEFIQLYNDLLNSTEKGKPPLSLIELAIEENNIELYKFLRESVLSYYKRLDKYLIENVNDTHHVVELLVETLDFKSLKSYIKIAYKNGRKNMFNRLIQIDPKLIDKINIMTDFNGKIDITCFKSVLSIAPPSTREIKDLISQSLKYYHYDLYIYLCSIEHKIKDNAKHLGQQLLLKRILNY